MLAKLKAKYGSRRGFVESKRQQLLYYLGGYKEYTVLPWSDIKRLVFVCSGNICRSAFAEAVAKTLGFAAVSAGVHAIEGAKADGNAISTAQLMGYDLNDHRTTPIMYPVYSETDLFVAMEPWQADIVQHNMALKYHVTLFGIWGTPVRPYLHDPYMCSEMYFKYCFNYIENTVHAIVNNIRQAN